MTSKPETPRSIPSSRQAGDLSGATIGQYRVVRRLGGGGMGAVYLAIDSLDRQVALKIPTLESTEALDRFKREALTSAQLNHPNIIMVYAAGHADGYPFLAMEYVEGKSLRAEMCPEEGGPVVPLPVRRTIDIIVQISDALEYAHSKGVTHRDIKPENIMLQSGNRGERARLLDFGIALRQGDPRLTREGEAQGTLYYIAPESLMMPPRYDGRSDLYSLGLVLFEMLTGRLPFDARTIEGIISSKLNLERITRESTRWRMGDGLFEVLDKVLARDPERRYQNAIELKEALEKALHGIERAEVSGPCLRLYQEAKRAFAAEEFSRALDLARRVMELDPHYEDIQSLVVLSERHLHERESQDILGQASEALERKRFSEAVALLDQVLDMGLHVELAEAKKELALRGLKAEQHLKMARDLAEKQQWSAAWKSLEDARRLAADLPGVEELRQQVLDRLGLEDNLRRGIDAARSGQWTEAVAVLSGVLEKDPQNENAAEWLARARNEREAERLYGEAIKALASEELARCQEILDRLKELAPDYPDRENLRLRLKEESGLAALFEQACQVEMAGEYGRAIETLERLRSRRPIYRDLNERLTKLRRWIELDGEQMQVGELIDQGKFDEALEQLAAIRGMDASFPIRDEFRQKAEAGLQLQALLTRARSAFKQNRWDECLEACDKILEIIPRHERVLELRRRAARARMWGWWYRYRRWFQVAALLGLVGAAVLFREPAVDTVKNMISPPQPAIAAGPARTVSAGMISADERGVRLWVPGRGVVTRHYDGQGWENSIVGMESVVREMPNRLALLATSPSDPNGLYVGLDSGLHISLDGGLSWLDASWKSGLNALSVVDAKGAGDRVYVAGSGSSGRGIRSTTDVRGDQWSEVSAREMGEVVTFAVDPREVNTLSAYTRADRRVWRTFDGGTNWGYSKAPEGAHIAAMAFSQGKPRRVIAAANPGGLFLSDDGGESWRPMDGWPQMVPADSVVAGPGELLLAGGWGSGLWARGEQGEWRRLLSARVQGIAVAAGARQTVFVLVEDAGRPRLIELSPGTLEQVDSVEVVVPELGR